MTTKIKETRELFHLTQQYVATYLDIPLFNYISIEEGEKPFSVLQLQKLQNLYGIIFFKREITAENIMAIINSIKLKRRINYEQYFS